MSLSEKGREAGIKFSYKGSIIGIVLGIVLAVICSHILPAIITPLVAFFLYDRPKYKEAVEKILTQRRLQKEQEEKALEEARIKEEKKVEKKIKAVQKKNRENKASLYENIYTVAGYILANQEDLTEYIQNAEDVISYFKASKEERRLAVEAFNYALDPEFNVDEFVENYLLYIGKNRDYINYVLTYALIIATVDDNIHYDAKDRLVAIGKAMGSSMAALKRLFKSNGAEARFAREFEKQSQEDLSDSTSISSFESKNSSSGKKKSKKSSSSSYNHTGAEKTSEALDILQLDVSATFDDIKKAYKKLMLKYHPDRLASQGLSEDMVAIYTDKAKAIQAAFDYLKKLYSEVI